jgi:hypothetical protein
MTRSVLHGAAPMVFAVVAVLAACGPGVGGTGTGTSALPAFGADAAALCSSSFAANLDCGAASPATPGSLAGTAPVVYAEPDGATLAEFDGNDVHLVVGCDLVVFDGTWGLAPNGAARFYGRAAIAGEAEPRLGALEVQAGGAATLVLVLRDERGVVIAGPLTMQRTSGSPASGC